VSRWIRCAMKKMMPVLFALIPFAAVVGAYVVAP
jgi:predicted branched-subunit amino acid permease